MKETIEKEARKTAVEWLIEAIESQKITIVYSDKILSVSVPIAIADQAKQMEKEQMEKCYEHGNLALWLQRRQQLPTGHADTFEQYYNETYGKETDRS